MRAQPSRPPGCHFVRPYLENWASQVVKNPLVNAGDIKDVVQSLGLEDPLEEGMATHSSVLAWRIPWTEETGGYSPQCCTVEHDCSDLACMQAHR